MAFYGVANVATTGAGALSGLFGLVVDLANGLLPLDAYAVAFALAALVAFSSLLPLRHVIHAAASTTHPSGRNASL